MKFKKKISAHIKFHMTFFFHIHKSLNYYSSDILKSGSPTNLKGILTGAGTLLRPHRPIFILDAVSNDCKNILSLYPMSRGPSSVSKNSIVLRNDSCDWSWY